MVRWGKVAWFILFGPSMWFLLVDACVTTGARYLRELGVPEVVGGVRLALWGTLHCGAAWVILFHWRVLAVSRIIGRSIQGDVGGVGRVGVIAANAVVLVVLVIMLVLMGFAVRGRA